MTASAPSARKTPPAAAHPATRYMSRDRRASNISRPRPGHDVTISTTNDPLSRLPKTLNQYVHIDTIPAGAPSGHSVDPCTFSTYCSYIVLNTRAGADNQAL